MKKKLAAGIVLAGLTLGPVVPLVMIHGGAAVTQLAKGKHSKK